MVSKDCLIIIRTFFLLTLFAVNFHAFNFELEEVWGHFWIALETSYSKMPSNFPWLKIKGMKIDSKNRQQNKCPDNFETVLSWYVVCGDYLSYLMELSASSAMAPALPYAANSFSVRRVCDLAMIPVATCKSVNDHGKKSTLFYSWDLENEKYSY